MLNSDLTICPVCEKRFIPSLFWAYKKKFYENVKNTRDFSHGMN